MQKFYILTSLWLIIFTVTTAFSGKTQTSVYWRTDGPSDGGWEWGSTCEGTGTDGQWYYNSWNGNRKRPTCFGLHDIYFDGNGINTMNLNSLEDYYVRRIFLHRMQQYRAS